MSVTVSSLVESALSALPWISLSRVVLNLISGRFSKCASMAALIVASIAGVNLGGEDGGAPGTFMAAAAVRRAAMGMIKCLMLSPGHRQIWD